MSDTKTKTRRKTETKAPGPRSGIHLGAEREGGAAASGQGLEAGATGASASQPFRDVAGEGIQGKMSEYMEFLAAKAPRAIACGIEVKDMPDHLFDFQAACTRFALRQGRSGLFLDTGLGKTRCELEFAKHAAATTNGRALILTPLAVARQIEREAVSLGYDAAVIREQGDVKTAISICNYDRMDKLDADEFGAVILDESGILKNFTGKTSRALINTFEHHRFRLAATATPAPNDHMELGQHAEFLGVMQSNEMLSRFFINDTSTASQQWRLKGHAVMEFWDWMASWSRAAESPEDLGFDGSRYKLPPFQVIRHRVEGNVKATDGLFAHDVSATKIHALKRQTTEARAQRVAELVSADRVPWVVWCDTDYESDALAKAIGDDAVEVRGSHSPELKEERLLAFSTGQARVIITKPSVAGMGLNWQHCARMAFVGRSFSYEAWYQAVRRCWRFGQTATLQVHLMVAEGEDQIGRVIDRKADDHSKMKSAMRDAMRRAVGASSAVKVAYDPKHMGRLPSWL